MGKGSSLVSSVACSCVDLQLKVASMSSLVAAYCRVEEVVDRPVAGSTFMLGVIRMAAKKGRKEGNDRQMSTTQTQRILSADR